ncbi:uncharacterized protein LOC120628479 [Pararge aegeria]|uniref:uncharacterized protein LOC120628479 n=1 Tax=Pararge aegeria TaxID=116150 RepID=UPI0019CFC65D|nr:uncharacterized protein LOC120628479 [Pararge aegeria]
MHSFNSTRQGRNLLDLNGFAPIHFPLTSYSTNPRTETKEEMKHTYGDTLYFNNLHLIPDPLKKNLADSIITGEEKNKSDMYETKEAERPQRPDYYPSLAGITSFFSGVLNVMGAIFQKRTNSQTSQYYDCFEDYNDQQMAPTPWQSSNIEVQNKNEREPFILASNNEVNTNLELEMSADCKLAASNCEEKLNQVRLLLTNKNKINDKPSKFRSSRPRKTFVEAGSVEDSFEDAFPPEDLMSDPNDPYIEFYIPYNLHHEEFIYADAPKVQTEMCTKEPVDKNNSLPVCYKEKANLNEKTVINDNSSLNSEEIVSSCEDKLGKLKALLQKGKPVVKNHPESTHKEPQITNPITLPVHRLENDKDMPNETVFGIEINSTELQNSQDSEYFNEVTGKFFSSSVESDDSFQIVFSDSPRSCRRRIPSECDSEDSFIVFEESPDSCYTAHDVFGEEVIDANHSDSDSDIEEDSGTTCKLAHNLSRTFGDLTDDSLYSHDVVDSVKVCNEICNNKVNEKEVIVDPRRGLLQSDAKKSEKQKLPPKKVTFSTQPPKVHVMRVWAFAARQARAGHWERHARDRERFKRRIADVEMAISWVFKRQHRTRVVFQRFRPWWNAERRRELAEKKEKEEREKEQKKEKEITEFNGEVNIINETEEAIDNIDSKYQQPTKKENLDDDERSKKAMECNGTEKKNDLSPNNESDDLSNTDQLDTEISKPVENLHNNITLIQQYSNASINNCKDLELCDDLIEITPGRKKKIQIVTTDDIELSNKFQELKAQDVNT